MNKSGELKEAVTTGDPEIAGLQDGVAAPRKHTGELSVTAAQQDECLASLGQVLSRRDEQIAALNREVSKRDQQIARLDREVARRDGQLDQNRSRVSTLEQRLADAQGKLSSFSWRVTDPLRRFRSAFPRTAELGAAVTRGLYWTLTLQLPQRIRQHRIGRLLSEGGLFDPGYYRSHYPDVADAGVDPLSHYLVDGVKEGRDPNPYFDTSYYLEENPDVAATGVNPLLHYLVDGFKEGRDPGPGFSTRIYLEQNPDVATQGVNPLSHFLKRGKREGRAVPLDPNCTLVRHLAGSGLFDTTFYLAENPDVADAGAEPILHYLLDGAAEGRNPNPLFDTNFYVQQNPDVAASGVNPLLHYLDRGFQEGREPGPEFSGWHYLQRNPDVAASGMNPLSHFMKFGAAEGRRPIPIPEHTAAGYWLNPELLASKDAFSYLDVSDESLILPRRVAIGVSSRGNFFMTEIGRMLESAFRSLGVRTRLFSERETAQLDHEEAVVVVAPHEFFLLGDGPAALETLRGRPTLVMINTEQLQTKWFLTARTYLGHATAVFDISYESARQLSSSGLTSFFLPLGYSDYMVRSFDGSLSSSHPLLQHMALAELSTTPTSYSDRPIDILFIGTLSPRRSSFFAAHAGFFASKKSFIYLPAGDSPFLPGQSRTIDFATFVGLAMRSKILLNIHRDTTPYLEWQRIVTLGILQKTLVITDHCKPEPCIAPNLDYLDAPLEALPALCDLVLSDPKTAGQIAQRSHDRLKATCPMDLVLGRCWTAMAEKLGAR